MNYRERIGQRIVQVRKSRGLTQRALAELSGVTYQNINKIELGRYSVGIDVLGKIVDALGCKMDIVERIEEEQ